ncbi:MAG TPA: DUF1963 domain-containing protein [Pirellulales bacterium]|nr:DUF1963 domain-containing protein [Pirellulales bacterium]
MTADAAFIEKVCQCPDELALLAGIIAQPANDLGRLVYADWLEKRGDARGPFLKRFVEAYRANRPLPDLNGVTAAWADLLGLTITAKAIEAGLRHRRDGLLAVARPALRIEAGEADFDAPPPPPALLGTTRLGGDPDLPRGAAYPTAADGVPLHFLGQFDLADFQGTIAGLSFPSDGLLSLFRPQSDETFCYPDPDDFPRFVRVTPSRTQLARVSRPVGLSDRPAPFRPGLRLVETLRLPAAPHKWSETGLTDEEESRLDEVFPTNLGGTAYILLGHVTHGNICEEPLKDRPDWLQLVLVPYFEGPDYGISDMSLSYQLPAADLKAGRFDRLEATFG